MTKFLAGTRIEYGEPDDDGVQKKLHVFEEGEEVTGLPKEIMAQLWDSGALQMVDGNETDPRIEAARHASYTGEGVDNELTNPDKAEKADQKASQRPDGASKMTPKGSAGTGRASA
jgi:hypothetical protein